VIALAIHGSDLYVGGDFATPGGLMRNFAVLDTATAAPSSWDAGANGFVWSLGTYGNTIYAGGGFTRFGGLPCAGLASFTVPEAREGAIPGPGVVSLAPISPNPAHSSARLRFTLPVASLVDLAVFDLQGRRVATVLRQALRAAGPQEITLPTESWPAGCYFCQLDAAGVSATRKMLVVR
jgi:hypothetical protein